MLKKPSLGLGTKLGSGIASNKSDLNSYLKSLTKKQKDVQRKYDRSGSATELDAGGGGGGDNATEDDSDLASLAKEFAKEEIQDSPFLKRRDSAASMATDTASRKQSTTASTPLPEQDAPFITSLVKKKNAPPPPQQTSSALESFMKFDRKYGVKGNTLAAAAAKTDSETEPEVSEEAVTPSKIASVLEEKVRSRRSSNAGSISRKSGSRRASVMAASDASPSPSKSLSRIQQKSRGKHLKLAMPSSAALSPIFTPESARLTASEVSELPSATGSAAGRNSGFDRSAVESPSAISHLHIMGIEELEMPEIVEEAEEENEAKTAASSQSPTSSGEETLKEDDDTIAKSPKIEKPLPRVPQFRGQQGEPQAVPTISRTTEKGSKSKEEGDKRSRRRRNGKMKPEPEPESEDLSDESSGTFSSSPPRRHRHGHRRRDQVRHQRHDHHHHRRRRHRSRSREDESERRPSCVYCQKLCNFHREEIANGRVRETPQGTLPQGQVPPSGNLNFAARAKQDESVQAGASSVFPCADHYLFDPNGDILYNAWSAAGADGISSRGRFATATSTSNRLPAPPTLALSELMKTQLDLTENFLRAQKRLYSSYCESLQEVVADQQQRTRRRRHHRSSAGGDKIMRPRSSTNRARERLSFAEAQKMVEAEMEVEGLRERDHLMRDMMGTEKVGRSDAEDEEEDAQDNPDIVEEVYEDDFEEGGDEDNDEIETETEGAVSNISSSAAASSVSTVL